MMIVDEFHQSIATYGEMAQEGHDPLDLLNIVDKRLADIANHIALCHRVIAEQNCFAHTSFFWGARKKHLEKVDSAGSTLDQVLAVQEEFFAFRLTVLRLVVDRLGYQSGRFFRSGQLFT